VAVADPTEGNAPLTVNLDAGDSHDPDGSIAKYEWDWEGDGVWDEDTGAASMAQHVYEAADYYNATDDDAMGHGGILNS